MKMIDSIVPLSLDEFYQSFLPMSIHRRSERKSATLRAAFSTLDQRKDKSWETKAIVDQFAKVVNDPKLAPGLGLVISPKPVDPEDPRGAANQKINGRFFPRGCKPSWMDHLVVVVFKGGDVVDNDPFRDVCEKAHSAGRKPEPPDASTKRHLDEFMKDAETVFDLQPRTHLFTLFIVSRYFHVLRWDHSGVVITPPVDYVTHPELLYEFLWRIGRASKAQLGLDPTATPIRRGSPEYKLMDQLSEPIATDLPAKRWEPVADGHENNVFEYVRTMFRDSLVEGWPRWKLSVPLGDGSTREFLVGKPRFFGDELLGRATQGYVAIDPAASEEKKKFVWLKDTWRTLYGTLESEGVALEHLRRNADDLFGFPTLVCHGDLPGQATLTPDIWERTVRVQQSSERMSGIPTTVVSTVSANTDVVAGPSTKSKKRSRADDDEQQELSSPHGVKRCKAEAPDDEQCPLRRYVHYRIVVEEVGRPLDTFEDGHHLVSVIYDCIKAHRSAAQADILHRDISCGNILIYPTVEKMKDVDGSGEGSMGVALHGVLTDWELAMDIKEPERCVQVHRSPYRLGTWDFMAVSLIEDPTKTAEVADELESFFHVLLYYAARFLDSNSRVNFRYFIASFFEDYGRRPNGDFYCGFVKTVSVKHGELHTAQYPGMSLWFDSPIDHILSTVLRWFKARYMVYQHAREQKKAAAAGTPKPKPPRPATVRPKKQTAIPRNFPDPSIYLPRPPPDPTSKEVVKEAERLSQHDDILALLLEAISEDPRDELVGGWSTDDKVPDRLRT
ncbi:hypothetical protein GY45DRAFT_327622 [Cubamyces sp. BRFM 1775]|nr:hypothetical protein GY45DRAFT_327622 [Cubamyces sp. BRFM 1775]